MKAILALFFFLTIYLLSSSQNFPVAYLIEEKTNAQSCIKDNETFFHSGFFPFIFLNKSYDSLINQNYFIREKNKHKPANFYYKSFYSKKDSDFVLHINPIFNYLYCKDDSTYGIMENTRGVVIAGNLSNNFRFVTGATETQGFYRPHINYYRRKNDVIPGGGRARPFKQTGFDFTNSLGYILFSFNSHWHFLFGHTRQFIGHGYRSLFLSDAPFEYPVLRIQYQYKRWQYICNYATFQSATQYDDRTKVFSRKYSSIHYLSFLPHKNVELGIFENTLFHAMSLKRNRPPEEYFIPIIFTHTSIYGLNHTNNAMLGTQILIKPIRAIHIYGQLAIDDYSKYQKDKQKLAWQYGIKFHEPLQIKNLFVLIEQNKSQNDIYYSPYEFAQFSQHNEPIAHILGNNFNETIFYAFYRYRIWFFCFKFNKATYYEKEKRLHTSSNALLSKIEQYKIETGILLHKPSRLTVTIGYHKRTSSLTQTDHYFFFGIKTRYYNFYDDF
ncbi:MAG: hypothetical protein N2449_04680 [Bacteroidales bacterium]|nr:hypothetical protein [Bacteroidales bacterium]